MESTEYDELTKEIGELRSKLMDLNVRRTDSRMDVPPRISVGLTRQEFNEIQEVAKRCSTSVSALGQLAIKHLLIQSRAGALPMLPPWRAEDDKDEF